MLDTHPLVLPFPHHAPHSRLYLRKGNVYSPGVYLFIIIIFWPLRTACGILVPQPGLEPPGPLAVHGGRARSPKHRSSRVVPPQVFRNLWGRRRQESLALSCSLRTRGGCVRRRRWQVGVCSGGRGGGGKIWSQQEGCSHVLPSAFFLHRCPCKLAIPDQLPGCPRLPWPCHGWCGGPSCPCLPVSRPRER